MQPGSSTNTDYSQVSTWQNISMINAGFLISNNNSDAASDLFLWIFTQAKAGQLIPFSQLHFFCQGRSE